MLFCNCDVVVIWFVFIDVVIKFIVVDEEDFFIVVICVIIRVIWRICKDDCILIFRKVCGKRDKKGFV